MDVPATAAPRIEDIPRIAFVTQRFSELQGLRTVVDAVPALIFAAGLHWAQSNYHLIILFAALAAYFAARATWIRSRLDAYYSRRLGRVDPSVPNLDATLLFGQFRPLGWSDRSGPNSEGIFLFYQGLITAPMCRDIHLPGFVQILVIASMLGFQPIWILIRDWPYRAHWLLPLGVGVAFAFRLAAVASAREVDAWQVLVCLCGGVALAIAGVFDHALLLRSLNHGQSVVNAPEQS
jgi:hypothetical protein